MIDSDHTSSGPSTNGRHPALGRVVATERRPNTPHEFHFWTALDSPVGIGTIVRVDGAHAVNGHVPRVYGVVVEGFGVVMAAVFVVLDVTPGIMAPSGLSRYRAVLQLDAVLDF